MTALESIESTLHSPLGIIAAASCAALLVLGMRQALSLASSVLVFIWRHYLRPSKPLASFGEWAVVTGATDGIGKAYCEYLASQGMKIYLISRNQSKLQAVSDAIEKTYKVQTKSYAADLVAAGAPDHDGSCWYGLKANLEELDIGILINNAGISYEHPEYLHKLDLSMMSAIISINCASLVKMASIVLPGMMSRKRGCIVNVSSAFALLPAGPLVSVYAATKAFVVNLSASLAREYASYGIYIQSHAPGVVATKMSGIRRTSTFVPSPAAYVKAARRHFGWETNAIPFPPHAVLIASSSAVPARVVDAVVLKQLQNVRSKALRKKATSQKKD